jgi:hypothetical protein
MGEISYQGDPPFHLPTTQPPSVRGDSETVEVTVFGSEEGKGPSDRPVYFALSVPQARQLITDLGRGILEAQKRMR